MTDDELNIAICKARGWKPSEKKHPDIRQIWISPAGESYSYLPNHINGIEALGHMHDAEKLLTEEQRDACYALAWKLARERVASDHTPNIAAGWAVYNTPAPQRAVALAKTLNLYIE